MTEEMKAFLKEREEKIQARRAEEEREQRGLHFHWQNLKKEDHSSKWLHGRCWLSRRPNYDRELHTEWVVPGRFDLSVTIGGNHQLDCCLGLLLFTLYFSLDRFALLRKWKAFESGKGMETSFSFLDWSLCWKVWTPEYEWSKGTPKWRDGLFSIPDFFLGRNKCGKVEQEPIAAVVPMPEGDYPVQVVFFEQTWKRPRWPWPKRRKGAEVVCMGNGIPVPGKGESAWDCDDTAYLSIGTSAMAVEEALAQARETIMQRRERYGGNNWQPEKVKHE